MIKIKWKYYWLIPFQEYWFTNSIEEIDNKAINSKLSNIFIYQSTNSNLFDFDKELEKTFRKVIFYTWIIELSKNLEDIFRSFSSTIRNEINKVRRVIDRENDYGYWEMEIETRYYFSGNSNLEKVFKEFIEFYNNEFAKYKLVPKLTYSIVKKYVNNLLIAEVKINWQPNLYHVYLIDKVTWIARLEYSVSKINVNKNFKRLLWWLNSYLHFKDMEYLKNEWFKIYDFGWLYLWESNWYKELEAQKQITQYKMKFHPEVVMQYHYIKESILYSILKRLYLIVFS